MNDYTTQIIEAAAALESRLDKALHPHDLGATQFRLLRLLSKADKLTPAMLAGLLVQTPHSVSGMLKRVEARGLVTRGRDSKDARLVWVSITGHGRNRLLAATPAVHEIESIFYGWLPSDSCLVLDNHEIRDAALALVPDLGNRAAGLERLNAAVS